MQEDNTSQVNKPVEETEVEPITDGSFFQVMKNELNRDAKFPEETMAALTEKFKNEKEKWRNNAFGKEKNGNL